MTVFRSHQKSLYCVCNLKKNLKEFEIKNVSKRREKSLVWVGVARKAVQGVAPELGLDGGLRPTLYGGGGDEQGGTQPTC